MIAVRMEVRALPVMVLLIYALAKVSSVPVQQPCSQCAPGWGLTSICTPTRATLCHVCPPRTYSPGHPHLSQCTPCSKCGEGLYEEKQCTRLRDTKCDSCDTVNGRFNEDFVKKCQTPSKIGHEKPGSLLERVDENFFSVDFFPNDDKHLSASENLDSDEEFWNNLDFLDAAEVPSSEQKTEEQLAGSLADLSVETDPEFKAHVGIPLFQRQRLLKLPLWVDKTIDVFPIKKDHLFDNRKLPLLFNGIWKYTPLPLNVGRSVNKLPSLAEPIPDREPEMWNQEDDFDENRKLPLLFNGIWKYTPLPLNVGQSATKLPGLAEPIREQQPEMSFPFYENTLDEEIISEKSDEKSMESLESDEVGEKMESDEEMQDVWRVWKINWRFSDNPPKGGDENPHHRFVENDGDQYVPHKAIPVKPSSRAQSVKSLLHAKNRRFLCILLGIACACFVATLIFVVILVKRCWRTPQNVDASSRYQQLQLQLSASDNKIIKECAAKFDNSKMLDRVRPGSDQEPLIQVQENPMALVHYLEMSSSEESLP